jgi:hypothetical protein
MNLGKMGILREKNIFVQALALCVFDYKFLYQQFDRE